MTDRDTFAAAALSGILTKDDAAKLEKMAPWWPEWACGAAYRWADAMLRERSRTGQAATDTPPQSRAGTNASEAEIDALEFVVEEGRTASVDDYGILRSWLIRLRPEWESQSYEESNEKRTNAAMNRDAAPNDGSVRDEGAKPVPHQTCPHVRGTVTQHCSLNFTLTDDEREAVEQAIDAANGMIPAEPWAIESLRKLLERLK